MSLWKVCTNPSSTLFNRRVAVYRPIVHDCESALISDNCIPAACRTNRPILSNLYHRPTSNPGTRVPGFEGRQTRKPGFEKYPPGLHSLHAGTPKNFKSTHIGYRAHRAGIFAFNFLVIGSRWCLFVCMYVHGTPCPEKRNHSISRHNWQNLYAVS